MTEIIDLSAHRARTRPDAPIPDSAPDLTKYDAPPAPREVLEGVVIPSGVPAGGKAAAGRAALRRSARAVAVTRHVVTHDRTKNGARLATRHTAYVAGGARILAKRAWDGRTTARYERMMRSAEAAGQHESALEWEQRAAAFRQQRHQRRMDLLTAPQRLVKGAVVGTAGTAGGLLGLGILLAVAEHNPDAVLAPTMFTIDMIRWAVVIVSVVWGPALFLAPWLAFLGLWNTGRHGQAAPQWTLPGGGPDKRDVVPDEGAILDALRNLGIPALNKAFKDGWQPRWVSPTVRLGNGYHTRLQLPMGVTVEKVNDCKKILAHNLLRLPVEVWPTEPRDQPGVIDLWVADQGSLSGPVPPWPLLTDGTADYFKGVPVGVSQRGEPVFGKLMAANYMIGGIMGTGKSSLTVGLLLGAMLDPLVDIDVYVMAYNIDYDPMRERLRTLVKGDEDEQIEAALDALRDLRDEVTERGKLLAELGGDDPKLTRELAERDPRMRPRVVVFDECHELFMHKKYGEEAAELAIKVMKKARKLGITLIWVTVSPTADSIPKDVTRNTSHRAAFAVGDHVANDGLLGTGKHRAGITATTLSPAEDVGTTLTVGFTKNAFELLRTYYVRKDASTDQVTPVVARALALREGVAPSAPVVPTGAPVDHLADIAAVLGDQDLMRTQEVLQRLAAHNLREYGGWTFTELRRVLDPHGAVRKVSVMVVDRAKVREALANRTTDADATDTAEGDFE
ncbi:DNA segregation ATPase FtsK/SpoIIIE, S-DNA-T family [Streptomyces sp. DvalAA-14]|uniref:cell division protein FtsK n=1 Tax=unclassified Streptomyces TaxID=2593676 RepID=UPI00081B80D5|nr:MULTISPECIES: cell division protein FtsK [unclassified Streptomyces]MYS24678.1 cell division protein FtsK [Streptomyces sp. SID4948]SCE48337.1 DNA segregation ATPase FtsK/SpoIIIE, S-DNA-T family [Streptomyces sp. DvalAA-14]